MRYVTITKSQLLQQRHRHRPERAGLGEVPAAGGQRHHRQRHLLEQLQLLRGRAVQAARASATGDARTRSASASCCSAAAATRSRTTASTATTSSASARSQQLLLEADRTRRTSIGNQVREQPVRARRHRPQRPRPVLRRQRHGQLLRAGNTGVADDDPGGRLDVRRRARSRAPTRSTRPRRAEVLGWARRPDHEAHWIRHPHAAKPGLTPLELYKGQAPWTQPHVTRVAARPAGSPAPRPSPRRRRRRRRGAQAAEEDRQGLRQLLRPDEADGERRLDVNWKWTDGPDRRPRRQAQRRARRASKKFHSDPGRPASSTRQTLTKPGTYKIICTLHEEDNMRMTVIVRSRTSPAPRRSARGQTTASEITA